MISSDSLQIQGFTGGRNQALTKSLLQARQRRNGLELLAIARHLKEINRYPTFNILFDDLRKVPPDRFWLVWTTPAAYFWTKLAWTALKPARRRSDLLERHTAWLRKPLEQFTLEHLEQLAVFTIASHLLIQKPYRSPCVVSVDMIGSFPGIGISWKSTVPFSLLGCTSDGAILVETGGEERLWPIHSVPLDDSPFFRTPRATGRGGIWLDPWDICMRVDYEGMEWTPRVTDYPSIQNASQRVTNALTRIEAYSEDIADEIGYVLSVASPLRIISESASPSGSVSFLPGTFYFANLAEEDRLAEMIIHEFSHNKLFLLQDHVSLLDPQRHGNGWEEQSYYSPWRDDPRPLQGILHGLFVFVEVAAFWADRLTRTLDGPTNAIAVRRFKTVFTQIEIACNVLEMNAHFTAVGNCLLDDLRDRIASMRGLAESIDGDSIAPLYAELHEDDRYEGLTLNEAIQRHRDNFMR